MKRSVVLGWILLGCSSGLIYAQSCQVADPLPAGLKKVGDGSAIAGRDGVTSVNGGQGVYVKIKNANVLGVSYNLTIEQDAIPPVPNCTYQALVPPGKSVILWGALFADPPIHWKVTVAVGEVSDAGVLTYEIYSQAPGAAKKKKSSASKNFKVTRTKLLATQL